MHQSRCKTTQKAAEKVQFCNSRPPALLTREGWNGRSSLWLCFVELAVLFLFCALAESHLNFFWLPFPGLKLIFYSLGMPSARKLLISLRAVVEYFKM
jgi:hypothetical protein